jgi:hypothetical protein
MGTWKNSDNLFVKLGTSEAASVDTTKGAAGEYKTFGSLRETEFVLDLTDLATATEAIINDTAIFPKNARIEEVQIEVVTGATSGGAATLDIGFVQNADRTTAIDIDGLAAAIALTAIDTAGERLTLTVGSTGVGAMVGTTTTLPALFTAGANTAVYTAGLLRVRVKWFAV